jgi:hypothetical protein
METIRIEGGTWTRRIRHHKAGIWWGLVGKEWLTDTRFRRARLVLVGGSTLLVPAAELQRVCTGSALHNKVAELFVDPRKGTINGQTVQLQIEA